MNLTYSYICIIVDGQKIAKRLSTSIAKETTTAQKILVDYNAIISSGTGECIQMNLKEILCPDSQFWNTQRLPAVSTSSKHDLPWDVKKDIIQAYLLVKRSQEELSLLAEEKLNILPYWMEQKVFINQQIDTLRHSYSIALLKKLLSEADYYDHTNAIALFHASSNPEELQDESDSESISEYEDEEEDISPST